MRGYRKVMMQKLYKVWHDCGDPTCKAIDIVDQHGLDDFRARFADWIVDEATGRIFSHATPEWQEANKTFHAIPLVESDNALTREQRLRFSYKRLHDGLYEITAIGAEWAEAGLNGIQIGVPAVLDFMQTKTVSNVIFNEYDKSVSGYDHMADTQFLFTPVTESLS